MRRLNLPGRILLGLLFAAISVGSIRFCATKLPYSHTRDEITDALSVPAVLIAQTVYPEGVHTGRGAPRSGIVFLCSDVLFYTVLWFVVFSIMARKRSPGSTTSGAPS